MVSTRISTEVVCGATSQLLVEKAELRIITGPDCGTSFELKPESILIGSASSCDLVLHDGTVSGRHAEIQFTTRGYFIRDLGSTNGVVCAGLSIDRAPLADGMRIELGETTLSVRALGEKRSFPLAQPGRLGGLVALSVKMRALVATLEQLAPSDATVLIEGETGSGKEVVAQTLHSLSRRKQGAFVVCDCAALTPSLAAAELFGVEKGAFTGANESRVGLIEEADGGTLFLDEIGELPAELQPLLLGAIGRKRSRRVGGKTDSVHDVRIIAATNRNLAEEARAGRFRQDLYYRLAVARVRVPPLRERPEDLPVLADVFASEVRANLSPEAILPLMAYEWPGNVRELRNTVSRLAVQPNGVATEVRAAPLRSFVFDEQGRVRPWLDARRIAGSDAEREYFRIVIEQTDGHLTKAAELAGISRQSVSTIAHRHGLARRGK